MVSSGLEEDFSSLQQQINEARNAKRYFFMVLKIKNR